MGKLKFRVDDVVVYTGQNGGDSRSRAIGPMSGMIGTVRIIQGNSRLPYGVEFVQRSPWLHSLAFGLCPGARWWCAEDELELVELEADENIPPYPIWI